MAKVYTHSLGQETLSISGWYEIEKEVTIEHKEGQILYLVGHATVDGSCCGYGGCRYGVVPGFIVNWKSGTNEEGLPISVVEPIKDENLKDEIRGLIEKKERIDQVLFW